MCLLWVNKISSHEEDRFWVSIKELPQNKAINCTPVELEMA